MRKVPPFLRLIPTGEHRRVVAGAEHLGGGGGRGPEEAQGRRMKKDIGRATSTLLHEFARKPRAEPPTRSGLARGITKAQT